MGTDVSDFSKKYSTQTGSPASPLVLPTSVTVTLQGVQQSGGGTPREIPIRFERVPYEIRYGTNPHQQCAVYRPVGSSTHIGDMTVHKIGKGGFSLTNLQDISRAVTFLKYMDDPACIILKHLGPCGFRVSKDAPPADLYLSAYSCDPRSNFGGTVALNREIDAAVAVKIMEHFTENVVATGYTEDALTILRRNEGTPKLNNAIRVVSIPQMCDLPKFWGDNVLDHLSLLTLPTGELSIEVPYLTGVRSIDDFIIDPEVDGTCVGRAPTGQERQDALIAWYGVMNIRSNATAIVKEGKAIGIGSGQPDRVGAVELAIERAKKGKHPLEGAVLASEAFFPSRDSVDYAARAGISAIVWPAGSRKDREIIKAANDHGMALMVPKTGERCFLHT